MSGLPTTRDITREPSAFHTTQKNVKEMFSGKPSLVDLWKENGLDDSTLENLTSVEDLNLDVNINTTVNSVDDNNNDSNDNKEESGVNDDKQSNVNDENTTGAEEETNTSSVSGKNKQESQENIEDIDDEPIPNWMIFGGVTASIGILTALALRKK